MLHDDPKLAERLGDVDRRSIARCSRSSSYAPSRWVSEIEFDGREFTGRLLYLGERLVDDHGTTFGYVLLYGPSLPASVLGLLTRATPAPSPAWPSLAGAGPPAGRSAVLRTWRTGAVSRRLPSAVYFELIRELVTAPTMRRPHGAG